MHSIHFLAHSLEAFVEPNDARAIPRTDVFDIKSAGQARQGTRSPFAPTMFGCRMQKWKIAFPGSLSPAVKKAKQMITGGKLGNVTSVSAYAHQNLSLIHISETTRRYSN